MSAHKPEALRLADSMVRLSAEIGVLSPDGKLMRIAALLRAQHADLQELNQAARSVLAERRRQVSGEGWTEQHDDGHDDGALSMAAAGYAVTASDALLAVRHELDAPGEPRIDDVPSTKPGPEVWPSGWAFKPAPPRQMLVKAGALILAEIERLDRAAKTTGETQ